MIVGECDRDRRQRDTCCPCAVASRVAVELHARLLEIMTTFSDEDCENLIELIRRHPPIYDVELDSHKDKQLKDSIWKSIAKTVNKTDSECRKKWKLIKDSYNRFKRKKKHWMRGATPHKNSKWQFYERMNFLENTQSELQSSAGVKDEDTNSSPEFEHEDIPDGVEESLHSTLLVEPILGASSIEEIFIPLRKSSENSIRENRKRKKERQESQNSWSNSGLEALNPIDVNETDDISTFTKHIEMMLRKLSARSRAIAKSEIFSIVSKYEIADIDGQSERPYSSSS